jgi:hypothetical protein
MSQNVPIEIVERLSKQGLTEMEIISQLKLRGFHEDQIHRAIQESIKGGVVGKKGVPARPHINAGESRLPIQRHPNKILQKPSPTLHAREMSAPLSKPPENIKLPDDLKPMELSDIGFKRSPHADNPIKPRTPQVTMKPAKPSFIEQAPVQPHAPTPITETAKKVPATPTITRHPAIPRVSTPALPPRFSQPIKQTPTHPMRAPTPKPLPPIQHEPVHPKPTPVQSTHAQKPHLTTGGPIKPKPLPLKPKKHEDITLEELVEEVVTTEVKKTDKRITDILNKTTKMQEDLQATNKKISKLAKLTEKKTMSIDSKVNETSSRIIAMENRIAALEEAFKSLGAAIHKTAPKRKK